MIAVPATTIAHVRVGVRRAGRRINDSRGNPGKTLCGAPITARDLLTYSDGWIAVASNDHRFLTCPKCREIIAARMA